MLMLINTLEKVTYSRVSLKRRRICDDITFSTVMTMAERKSNIRLTKDTPYLALMGKLWGVFCEDLGENWRCYNGTTV